MNTKQFQADMMLVFVTLCWGVSYYMMSVCLAEMGPFTLNSYRFLGAFLIAGILSYSKLKNVNKITIKYSILIALALYVTYMGATYGVMYTSLSNVGFLCGLAVVIVPVIDFFFKKRVPSKKLGLVVLLSLIGIALLTLTDKLTLGLGDILCLMCSFAYGIDMVLTETAVNKEKVNAFQLGVFQLLFTGIFCMITALLIETPSLPKSSEVWFSLTFLTVMCTGLAFICQCIAQQYTSATHVGIIFGLEPVFAAFVAYFLAGEILSTRGYIGAAILMIGFFIMEVDFSKLIFKKKQKI